MNIAVVGNNRQKFSETFIQNQVKLLPFNTHFFYGDYLPPFFNEGSKFMGDSFIEEQIVLLRKTWLNQSSELQLKNAIAQYLRKNKIEVVLANYALCAFPFLDICKRANIPLVVHFHGYTAYRTDIYSSNIENYHRLFKDSAAIVAVSQHMKDRLITLGAPAEKIILLTCGADETLFSPPTNRGNEKTILCSGRFCDTKNPHLVILAFAELQKHIPDAELIMVGDGELMSACVQLAKSLRLSDKISFKGILPHQQVAEQMRNAAVFVQFSATTPNNDTEGTPLAVLEAGLSGLPVIASRSGGLPEIISDNETGFLVNELDTDSLVLKMKEALLNREKSLQMAARLRGKVLQNYTLKHYTEKLAALITSVAVAGN